MLKSLIIGAVAATAALSAPLAASAQHYDRDRDGRYERWERRADRNYRDGGRYTRREQYNDYRRGQRYQSRYYRGAVLPYNYRRNWYVSDYRRHGWRAPPRGYGYYRTDTGDIVVAAIATGVILSLLNDY